MKELERKLHNRFGVPGQLFHRSSRKGKTAASWMEVRMLGDLEGGNGRLWPLVNTSKHRTSELWAGIIPTRYENVNYSTPPENSSW